MQIPSYKAGDSFFGSAKNPFQPRPLIGQIYFTKVLK